MAKIEVITSEFNDMRISNLFDIFKGNYTRYDEGEIVIKEEYNAYRRLSCDIPLTNNIAEAFNNAFSKDMNYGKIEIWGFLDVVKRRQAFIEEDIRRALESPAKTYSNKARQFKMQSLKLITANYDSLLTVIS